MIANECTGCDRVTTECEREMLDATGRYRMQYANVFRAIGHYLGRSGFRDVTMAETAEGFIITGHSITSTGRSLEFELHALLFADTDIDTLLTEAFERRGKVLPVEATLPSVAVGDMRVRYEDVLRCIGKVIDDRRWQKVVVMQVRHGFHIKGIVTEQLIDAFLDAETLHELLTELPTHRRTQ
jgi:hypothetical protein